MSKIYNLYCDESCHLQYDGNDIMVIGTVYCEKKYSYEINTDIRKIKEKYGISLNNETKWNKAHQNKIDYYTELIRYFFDNDKLNFRCVVATNKKNLNCKEYNISYDDWYNRIYYLLIKELIDIENNYRIYMDIKDSLGGERVKNLKTVLNRTLYDFTEETIDRVQIIRSDEVEIMQLTDLLIGAVSYKNRRLATNTGKNQLIQIIENLSGKNLTSTSKPKMFHGKFDIFVWEPGHKKYGKM